MNIIDYQREAQATKSLEFFGPWDRAGKDILHAIMGIATEAGELLDPLKKTIFYGKPNDFVNLDEEIGDILWYIAIYAEARGTTIEALATANNAKLKARFPANFTMDAANNRDLDVERKVLEENLGQQAEGDPHRQPIRGQD